LSPQENGPLCFDEVDLHLMPWERMLLGDEVYIAPGDIDIKLTS
jgi:hypothetical protein